MTHVCRPMFSYSCSHPPAPLSPFSLRYIFITVIIIIVTVVAIIGIVAIVKDLMESIFLVWGRSTKKLWLLKFLVKLKDKFGVKVVENINHYHHHCRYVTAFGELAKSSTTMLLPGNPSDVGSAVAQAMSIYGKVGVMLMTKNVMIT